jgi:hypothetical protein
MHDAVGKEYENQGDRPTQQHHKSEGADWPERTRKHRVRHLVGSGGSKSVQFVAAHAAAPAWLTGHMRKCLATSTEQGFLGEDYGALANSATISGELHKH